MENIHQTWSQKEILGFCLHVLSKLFWKEQKVSFKLAVPIPGIVPIAYPNFTLSTTHNDTHCLESFGPQQKANKLSNSEAKTCQAPKCNECLEAKK